MTTPAPSPLDLAETLFHRTIAHMRGRGPLPARWHDAVRAVGRAAWRVRARSLDAVVFEGTLRITVDAPGEALPSKKARAAMQLGRLSGLAVRFDRASSATLPKLRRDEPAGPELARAARWCLARLDGLVDDAIEDRDPEAVHQTRVALRRLRCVLRAFGHAGRHRWVKGATAFVRALGSFAGALRDLDVALDAVPDVTASEESRGAAVEALRAKRVPALAHFREHFEAALHGSARADFEAALRDVPKGKRSLRGVAKRHLRDELRGLLASLGGDLTHAEGYHAIRKRARRVRDAVDVFAPALTAEEHAWRRALQPLQTQLGALNDAAVMAATLADVDGAGLVRDALDQRRLALLAELATPLALLANVLDRR